MDVPGTSEKDPLQFLLAMASGLQQIPRNPEGDQSAIAGQEPRETVSAAMPTPPTEDQTFGQDQPTTESMAAFLKEFEQLVGSAGIETSSEVPPQPKLATEAAKTAEPSLAVVASSAPEQCESRQLAADSVTVSEHEQPPPSPVVPPRSGLAEPQKQPEAPFYAVFQRAIVYVAGPCAILLLTAAFILLTSKHQKAAAPPAPARPASTSSLPQRAGNSSSTSSINAPTPTAEPALVSAVRPRSSRDSSQVEVALNQVVAFDAHRISSPERVYFDLANAHLAPDLDGKTLKLSSGMITRIRMAERENSTARITLQTDAAFDYSAEILPHPYRLIIRLRSQQPSRPPASGSPDEHGGDP